MDKNDFNREYAEKLIEAFRSKVPELKCPVCGNEDFDLLPGYHVHILQKNINFATMPPNGGISMSLSCKKCGYILDFLIDKVEENAKTKK